MISSCKTQGVKLHLKSVKYSVKVVVINSAKERPIKLIECLLNALNVVNLKTAKEYGTKKL